MPSPPDEPRSIDQTFRWIEDAVSGVEGSVDGQRRLTQALESLNSALAAAPVTTGQRRYARATDSATESEHVARRIELLVAAQRAPTEGIEPELSPTARVGHAYPVAETILEEGADGYRALEELAGLGLLQRRLVNRVHVCAECEHCQLNFRELCPKCASIDLHVEQVTHHFRCGYTGLESEFGSGIEMACPKCRRELFQLGQDFDRPHETYVCGACSTLFEEPRIQAQCMGCGHESDAHETITVPIHAFHPTPQTSRAIELGRLTGLDVDAVLYDADLKIATRDFLAFEIKRELIRLKRNGTAFSMAKLSFEQDGAPIPVFETWTAAALRDLCARLAGSLRSLDLVTRLNAIHIGVFMPEAPERGAEVVRKRLFHMLDEVAFRDRVGRAVIPAWEVVTWSDRKTAADDVMPFLGDGPEAVPSLDATP